MWKIRLFLVQFHEFSIYEDKKKFKRTKVV
jgi:hypothetical protein